MIVMKKKIIKQIFFWCILISLNASCTSITKLFPKQPRPFQAKEFNSEEWKNGDYQTRGEMADSKLTEQIYKIDSNSQEQILQLLGKPDAKTRARCCYAGRGGQSGEVDLWLYYVETEGWTKDPNVKPPLEKKALKIYFDGARISLNFGDRDSDHDYFPKIGYFKLIANERSKI
jgi:hypothetical protein